VIGDSMPKLRAGGVLCLTGVGSGGIAGRVTVADASSAVVLKNLVLIGSVNANKRHRCKAAEALARADRTWLGQLITRREKPENFQQALDRQTDDIKALFNSPTSRMRGRRSRRFDARAGRAGARRRNTGDGMTSPRSGAPV
jgi:threonine dehydrogenase-like Zn-dependent dehydrogenase